MNRKPSGKPQQETAQIGLAALEPYGFRNVIFKSEMMGGSRQFQFTLNILGPDLPSWVNREKITHDGGVEEILRKAYAARNIKVSVAIKRDRGLAFHKNLIVLVVVEAPHA